MDIGIAGAGRTVILAISGITGPGIVKRCLYRQSRQATAVSRRFLRKHGGK